MLRTCVTPKGSFRVGIHRPGYRVRNLRDQDFPIPLGTLPDGTIHDNRANFPPGDVEVEHGTWIYEIANPFSFRGATFIDSGWAEARVNRPELFRVEPPAESSLRASLAGVVDSGQLETLYRNLPQSTRYDLAANSTDREELVLLARISCELLFDRADQPTGLKYKKRGRGVRPVIDDLELFETIANNPFLPDQYKVVMVLRPGTQGSSEIVGHYLKGESHIFEYLRRNSYIPWGHFAANMAHDAVRYRTSDLSSQDMQGLRHLYYQRMYVTLADKVGVEVPDEQQALTVQQLEKLRKEVLTTVARHDSHPATLWGWNFGYDFSGSGYRLHASHQMIHQQFAMVPHDVELLDGSRGMSYSCGDQIAEVIEAYKKEHGSDFFNDYISCIRENERPDNNQEAEKSLIVYADGNVMLFVPKAQVSQWELQLLVTADLQGEPVGNVLEADTEIRTSIDGAILTAQHIFAGLGVKMVTSLEFSKRIGVRNDQRLLYSFLPKLPWSMGAFSEAQQRYISGHFPEDFATACRLQMDRKHDTEAGA